VISGTEQGPVLACSLNGYPSCPWYNPLMACTDPQDEACAWDTGTITVTFNNKYSYSASWNGYLEVDTPSTLATALADAINSSKSSPATAESDGGTVLLFGASSISLSVNVTFDSTDYWNASFSAVPSGSTFVQATSGFGGVAPVWTSYSYDALGNLKGVTQGSQTRGWQYDGLSRLTQETTPEAGTVTVSYLTSGGAFCSGDPSNPCSRTAPAPNQTGTATVTTTYSYDTANRLTTKAHSDTTGPVTYTYRAAAVLGRVN